MSVHIDELEATLATSVAKLTEVVANLVHRVAIIEAKLEDARDALTDQPAEGEEDDEQTRAR